MPSASQMYCRIFRALLLAAGLIWHSGFVAGNDNPCYGSVHGVSLDIAVEHVGPMSSRNQAAWWSPIAHYDGSIYVSYLAPNSPQDDVVVAKRESADVWTVQDTGFNSRYDLGHTQTSIAFDGHGRMHLFYGMHGDPITYARANQPGTVTGGFQSISPAAFAGGSYTYPNLTTAPNGDVYSIIRNGAQGRLFRFSNASQTWSQLPAFAAQSGTTVYPDHIFADVDGQLHIIWEWAAGGAQGSRHFGSYARFDPATNIYYRANGTPYAGSPITVSSADVYQGLEGGETFTSGVHGVQSAKLTLDDQGHPIIAYSYSLTGTGSGYEHRLARWTGSEWIRSTITPGPFGTDKSWVAFSDGVLRYYGTLSPSDPLHTGRDDIFVRLSTDYGDTWSDPIAVTQGLNVQRPVGITVGNTDYLYLPAASGGQMYVAVVQVHVPEPATAILGSFALFCFVSRSTRDPWRSRIWQPVTETRTRRCCDFFPFYPRSRTNDETH
jgi:hypothetical protein